MNINKNKKHKCKTLFEAKKYQLMLYEWYYDHLETECMHLLCN